VLVELAPFVITVLNVLELLAVNTYLKILGGGG
jgi:hypothetical protein